MLLDERGLQGDGQLSCRMFFVQKCTASLSIWDSGAVSLLGTLPKLVYDLIFTASWNANYIIFILSCKCCLAR